MPTAVEAGHSVVLMLCCSNLCSLCVGCVVVFQITTHAYLILLTTMHVITCLCDTSLELTR